MTISDSEFVNYYSLVVCSNAEESDTDGETDLPPETVGALLPLVDLLGALLIKNHKTATKSAMNL